MARPSLGEMALARAMEDVLCVLHHATEPLGPMAGAPSPCSRMNTD